MIGATGWALKALTTAIDHARTHQTWKSMPARALDALYAAGKRGNFMYTAYSSWNHIDAE
jgi:hypothetical protein